MQPTGRLGFRCNSQQAACNSNGQPCTRCGGTQWGSVTISPPSNGSGLGGWGIMYELEHTPCSSLYHTNSSNVVYPGATATVSWGDQLGFDYDTCPILILWVVNTYTTGDLQNLEWNYEPPEKPFQSRIEIYPSDGDSISVSSQGCIQYSGAGITPVRDLKFNKFCANDPDTLAMQNTGNCLLCKADSATADVGVGDGDGNQDSSAGSSIGTLLVVIGVGAVVAGLILLLIFLFNKKSSWRNIAGRPTYR